MTDESVPVWIVIFVVACGVAIIGIFVYGLRESVRYSRLPQHRVYQLPPEQVRVGVLRALKAENGAAYDIEADSISFSAAYMGAWGAAVAPVVHVIILPRDDGWTSLEVIGARGPLHYSWHALAQRFLTTLDRLLLQP